MNYRERITFLVGAGLVKDAGLPTSIELAQKLKLSLKIQCEEEGNSEHSEVAARLLSLFRFLNGGIRFQEGFLDRDPDESVNIEQIAVAALSLRQRLENPLAPYTSGWHQRLSELEAYDVNLTHKFEAYIYSKLTDWLEYESDASISYLIGLSDSIDKKNAIDIFSLNYDLCIEKALKAKRDVQLVNGFSASGWNPEYYLGDPDIRLFKLHGSLDWIEDEAYGVCSLREPRHKDAEDIIGTQQPLLIFGTNHKLSARQPFLTLAYYLSQAVLSTRVLAIIGYSFGDEYVNEIIEQGFRNNTRLRIIIVTPEAEKIIDSNRFFKNSPRVMPINLIAKTALNDRYIQRAIDRQLNESAEDDVFK